MVVAAAMWGDCAVSEPSWPVVYVGWFLCGPLCPILIGPLSQDGPLCPLVEGLETTTFSWWPFGPFICTLLAVTSPLQYSVGLPRKKESQHLGLDKRKPTSCLGQDWIINVMLNYTQPSFSFPVGDCIWQFSFDPYMSFHDPDSLSASIVICNGHSSTFTAILIQSIAKQLILNPQWGLKVLANFAVGWMTYTVFCADSSKYDFSQHFL